MGNISPDGLPPPSCWVTMGGVGTGCPTSPVSGWTAKPPTGGAEVLAASSVCVTEARLGELVVRLEVRRVLSCLNLDRLEAPEVTGTNGFSQPDTSCWDFFRSLIDSSL